MKQLQGRVAAITGAASGIGRATAELLGSRGCSVALIDINENGLEQAARELGANGVKTSVHLADVADAERMRALPAEVVTEHGAVHIMINNAGVSVLKSFEDHSLEDLHWLIGINFWGVVHGCKFFLPELCKAPEAHIVNVSSMSGFFWRTGTEQLLRGEVRGKGPERMALVRTARLELRRNEHTSRWHPDRHCKHGTCRRRRRPYPAGADL